ncbi:hypothetical protein CPB83DRAFT_865054 [Crepidotus variabilis]|uniref:Uncharacterized protein n=1 Tax=Crepidotus variabilis TaxID=179855 RepID=A0A9P6E3X6_9AGAR|nr:hypothetical protein CPB83DRAFT_865054 [Crepidotus variabilis]
MTAKLNIAFLLNAMILSLTVLNVQASPQPLHFKREPACPIICDCPSGYIPIQSPSNCGCNCKPIGSSTPQPTP